MAGKTSRRPLPSPKRSAKKRSTELMEGCSVLVLVPQLAGAAHCCIEYEVHNKRGQRASGLSPTAMASLLGSQHGMLLGEPQNAIRKTRRSQHWINSGGSSAVLAPPLYRAGHRSMYRGKQEESKRKFRISNMCFVPGIGPLKKGVWRRDTEALIMVQNLVFLSLTPSLREEKTSFSGVQDYII